MIWTGIQVGENQIRINEENQYREQQYSSNQILREIQGRIQAMDSDIEKRNKRLVALNRDKENYTRLLQEAEGKLSVIVAQLDEEERRIELMKQEVMDKLDDLSESRTRFNSLKNECEAFIARHQKVDGEIQKTILDRDKESMLLEAAQNNLRSHKEALTLKKEAVKTNENCMKVRWARASQ